MGDHAYNLNLRPSGYEHEYSLLLLFLESSRFRGNMFSIYSGLTAPTVTFCTGLGYLLYWPTVTFCTGLRLPFVLALPEERCAVWLPKIEP